MNSQFSINRIILCIPLFLFTALMFIYFTGINHQLFLYLNKSAQFANPILWSNITILGDTSVALLILLPFIRRRPDIVWAVMFAGLFSCILLHTTKHLLNIPRPPAVFGSDVIQIIGPIYKSHSFPSGHACTIFTILVTFMHFGKQFFTIFILFIIACIIALSRVCVGVHWPIDIFAGALLGTIAGIIGYFASQNVKSGYSIYLRHLWAIALILNGIYVLIFHNTQYPDTILLQKIYALFFLAFGIYEYTSLWIKGYSSSYIQDAGKNICNIRKTY